MSQHVRPTTSRNALGTWGTAQEVPGTVALNQGGGALVNSVSCASAGNCGTGGSYADASGHHQAFVVAERNGIWRTARKVPGLAVLDQGEFAAIFSVLCASPAHCSAGGSYADTSGHSQAFVVSET